MKKQQKEMMITMIIDFQHKEKKLYELN